MPESPERKGTNIRLDPVLHFIMKGMKDVLGHSSVDTVYDQAISEFIDNHPELAKPALETLQAEETIIQQAMARLRQAPSAEA